MRTRAHTSVGERGRERGRNRAGEREVKQVGKGEGGGCGSREAEGGGGGWKYEVDDGQMENCAMPSKWMLRAQYHFVQKKVTHCDAQNFLGLKERDSGICNDEECVA